MIAVPISDDEVQPVDARGLRITKGSDILLNNIYIKLERGDFAALVGPSGCGKTSLLRVLSLLDQPTCGTVRLFGREYKSDAASSICHDSIYPRLNYVPQTLGLWPHLTIRENLLFATDGKSNTAMQLEHLCKLLGIATILDRKPQFASQGQRQRSALVRAMVLQPQVLLLDEMTAALDGKLASIVWDLLRTFANDGGVVLASTHDPSLALQCSKVYRICDTAIKIERMAAHGDGSTQSP